MASFRAVGGSLDALKNQLELHISTIPSDVVESPLVSVLGTQNLKDDPGSNTLGIYLHRVEVDSWGRNRYLPPTQPGHAPAPELPVNLHILLIGWSPAATAEATLVAWAMQQIGSGLTLDISHLLSADERWREGDVLQVQPEDMSSEDLMRIWDSLPNDYRLSVPYVIKTLRLEPASDRISGPAVKTIVTPMASNEA